MKQAMHQTQIETTNHRHPDLNWNHNPQKSTHETHEFRTNTVAHSQQTQSTKTPPKIQDQRQNPNAKEGGKENSTPPCHRLGLDLVGLMGSRWADGFWVDGLCDFQVDVLSHV